MKGKYLIASIAMIVTIFSGNGTIVFAQANKPAKKTPVTIKIEGKRGFVERKAAKEKAKPRWISTGREKVEQQKNYAPGEAKP